MQLSHPVHPREARAIILEHALLDGLDDMYAIDDALTRLVDRGVRFFIKPGYIGAAPPRSLRRTWVKLDTYDATAHSKLCHAEPYWWEVWARSYYDVVATDVDLVVKTTRTRQHAQAWIDAVQKLFLDNGRRPPNMHITERYR